MTPAGPAEVRAALDAAGRLGGFFRIAQVAPGAAGWRPVADLYAGGGASGADRSVREPGGSGGLSGPGSPGSPGGLGGLVTATAHRLGTAERRVAASILYQGFAARLWSVTLGPILLAGVLPALAPAELLWRGTVEAPLEVAVTAAGGWSVELASSKPRPPVPSEHPMPGAAPPAPASRLDRTLLDGAVLDPIADRLHRTVVDGHLAPLALRLRDGESVSERILAGNAVSALVGTLRVMPWRPAVPALTRALLDRPGLRGAGTADLGVVPPEFVRASCCLYYRVPGGGLCGDCVLRR